MHELVRDHLPEKVGLRDLGEHRLKDLIRAEQIFQVTAPDLPATFPELKSLDSRSHNLPVQPTPLIGRENELSELQALLLDEDVALVTLTGPGGIGKTRLSLQTAANVLAKLGDGVFFIDLAPLRDPDLLAFTIAQTLGLREETSRSMDETLKEYLRNRQMLLVLDNFEQIVAAASIVAEFLTTCPKVKVLVTSREVLHVRGEHEYPVPTLAVPDLRHLPSMERLSHYAAVSLFIQQAITSKPKFVINNDNAPAVAEICHRLDGLPLAIELAASRIGLLPPKVMLVRLAKRLPMLTGGARDLPARQRTLRSTIDWSFELLTVAEQKLFASLSIFAKGFTLEAAEAVIGDKVRDPAISFLDRIASLADKSLLQHLDPAGEEEIPRLLMLETIREYALERLEASGKLEDLQAKHAQHYLALAEEAEPELIGAQQVTWLDRLGDEHNNLRASLRWAVEHGESEIGMRLAGAVWRFWYVRGYLSEGRRWLRRVGQQGSSLPAAVRVKTTFGSGGLAWAQGDFAQASNSFEETLALQEALGDRKGMAAAFNGLGLVALDQGDLGKAAFYLKKSLVEQRELGNEQGIAGLLNNLGRVAMEQGDFPRSKAFLAESLEISERLGDKSSAAMVLLNMGRVEHFLRNYSQATSFLERSLGMHEMLANKRGVAFAISNLAQVALAQHDAAKARPLFEKSLALHEELGDKQGISYCLSFLGMVALQQNRPEQAATTLEKGLEISRKLGDKSHVARQLDQLGQVLRFQAKFKRANVVHEEGLALAREMNLNHVVASILHEMGHIAAVQGQMKEAVDLFEKCLTLNRELGNQAGVLDCLAGLADVARMGRQLEKATRLLGAAEAMFEADDVPDRGFVENADYSRIVHAVESKLEDTAFATAWEKGRSLSMEEAIDLAMSIGHGS
jgi:predicted ATPase/Tfp pilus assembly protein PilF